MIHNQSSSIYSNFAEKEKRNVQKNVQLQQDQHNLNVRFSPRWKAMHMNRRDKMRISSISSIFSSRHNYIHSIESRNMPLKFQAIEKFDWILAERRRHDAIETSEFSAHHVAAARHDSDEIENGGISAQFARVRDRLSSSDLERKWERKEIDSRKFGTDASRDQQLDTKDRGQRSFPLLLKFHRGLGETWKKEVGGSRKGKMRSTTGKFGRRREFFRCGHYLWGGRICNDADQSKIVFRATIDERWTCYVPIEAS